VRVTAHPSSVRIESVLPFEGNEPAKVTEPAAGASTVEPADPATSTPR
jgi:hypothetical protein